MPVLTSLLALLTNVIDLLVIIWRKKFILRYNWTTTKALEFANVPLALLSSSIEVICELQHNISNRWISHPLNNTRAISVTTKDSLKYIEIATTTPVDSTLTWVYFAYQNGTWLRLPSSETKVLIFRFSVERGLYRPTVKCGIPEFRHGIPDAFLQW